MSYSNKKMKTHTIILSLLLFLGCKQSCTKEETTLNLDSVIFCSNYVYEDGYFTTPSYGCIYNPKKGNELGNLIIYLIPKKKTFKQDAKKINFLKITEIKKKFDIYIYLIDKKYLDPIYYSEKPYIEQLFHHNEKLDSWELIDSIKIKNFSENIIEQQKWREDFITSKTRNTYKEVVGEKENVALDLAKTILKRKFRITETVFGDCIESYLYENEENNPILHEKKDVEKNIDKIFSREVLEKIKNNDFYFNKDSLNRRTIFSISISENDGEFEHSKIFWFLKRHKTFYFAGMTCTG